MVSRRRMRLAMMKDDQAEYRCCVCLHVRTGTVLLGMWHLVLQMIVLTMFASMALQSDLTTEPSPGQSAIKVYVNAFGNRDGSMNVDLLEKQHWSKDDRSVGMLISVCTLVLTLMLVYGALKGRPGYLMPFFCLQVFDFCITCLSAVAYFSYMPNVKDWINQQTNLPMRDELTKCGDWLMLLVILMFVLIMTIKAYFIGVVWACYKFLCRRSVEMAGITADGELSTDTEMLLPPKYEDAIKYNGPYPIQVDMYPAPPPYTSTESTAN